MPEVYAAAGGFALFGSSVTALKSVTLAVFPMYAALNFALLHKIAPRWVAVSASLLLIVAPPALVFRSLWAGAEYMFVMLLGTLLLLILERAKSREQRDKGMQFQRCWPVAAGLAIGYAPALLYAIFVETPHSPVRSIDARRLMHLNTQSHRYLIPWYAGLSVAWAVGSLELARTVRLEQTLRLMADTTYYLASVIVGAIIAVHAWQQVAWYQKLEPDIQTLATIDCLKSQGIGGGYAEYWTAYKMTFRAHEDIIIAPTDGIDR